MRPLLLIAALDAAACTGTTESSGPVPGPDGSLEPPGGRDTSRRGLHSSFPSHRDSEGPVTQGDRDKLAGKYRNPNKDGRPERIGAVADGAESPTDPASPPALEPSAVGAPLTPGERDRLKGSYQNPNKDGRPERLGRGGMGRAGR